MLTLEVAVTPGAQWLWVTTAHGLPTWPLTFELAATLHN